MARLSVPHVDRPLLAAVANGLVREAVARLSAAPPPDPLVAELVAADIATRRGESSVVEGAELLDRIAAAPDPHPVLVGWANATLAERSILALDPAGIDGVEDALAGMPEATLASGTVLWIRGRLRRMAALGRLYARPPDHEEHQRLQALAIADFVRCGLPVEAAVARALTAGIMVLWLNDSSPEWLGAAIEARRVAGAHPGSSWIVSLDLVVATLGLTREDTSVTDEALGEVRLAEAAGWASPAIVTRTRLIEALRDIHADTSDAPPDAEVSRRLHDGVESLAETDPLTAHHFRLGLAHILADRGATAEADALMRGRRHLPAFNDVEEWEHDVLDERLALRAGRDPDLRRVEAALDALERSGHERRIDYLAVSLADDLDTAGRPDDARRIRARAGLEAADVGGGDAAAGPRLAVRVMAPAVEVDGPGGRIGLRTSAARLLLALVVDHPDPVHVEMVAEALWPNEARVEGWRRRVNVVVYRLRRALGDAGAAVRREGEMLALAPDGWEVDLWALRAALTRSDGGPCVDEILADARGNLAHAQFPYDDELIDERRSLAAAYRALPPPLPDEANEAAERARTVATLDGWAG